MIVRVQRAGVDARDRVVGVVGHPHRAARRRRCPRRRRRRRSSAGSPLAISRRVTVLRRRAMTQTRARADGEVLHAVGQRDRLGGAGARSILGSMPQHAARAAADADPHAPCARGDRHRPAGGGSGTARALCARGFSADRARARRAPGRRPRACRSRRRSPLAGCRPRGPRTPRLAVSRVDDDEPRRCRCAATQTLAVGHDELLGRPPTVTSAIAVVCAGCVVRRAGRRPTSSPPPPSSSPPSATARRPAPATQRSAPRPAPTARSACAAAGLRGAQHGRRLVGRDHGLLRRRRGAAAPTATTRSGAGATGWPAAASAARPEVAGRREALVGVLGQRARDDLVEARGHVGRASCSDGGGVVEVRPQRRLVGLALVGRRAGQRVVEHAARARRRRRARRRARRGSARARRSRACRPSRPSRVRAGVRGRRAWSARSRSGRRGRRRRAGRWRA